MWITGQVWDEYGGPLAGVTIELSHDELFNMIRRVVTDAEGRYVVLDLKPGTYRIRFSREGFSTAIREAMVFAEGLVSTVCTQLKSVKL